MCLFLPLAGAEAEAHGGAADVGGVGPRWQGADRGPDRAVGGQPRAAPLRAVQAQVLHGLAAERRAAQPKGEEETGLRRKETSGS